MRQFMFLDELQHLQPGYPCAVETSDDVVKKLRRLAAEPGRKLVQRRPEAGG